MTRIVGLDLSLTSTGIALPDGTTRTLHPRVVDLGGRLNQLGTDLWRILEPHAPQLAIIEGYAPSGSRYPLGYARRAEWVGCVRRDLRRMRCLIVEVRPNTLKAWATNNGNAPKERMIEAAQRAGGHPANDDEADAYLLWAIGRLTVDDVDLFRDAKHRIRRLALADQLAWPDVQELTSV